MTSSKPNKTSLTPRMSSSRKTDSNLKWRILRLALLMAHLIVISILFLVLGSNTQWLPALFLYGLMAAIWAGAFRIQKRFYEYGTARWANIRDCVERRFLFHRNGLIVGKVNLPSAVKMTEGWFTSNLLWNCRYSSAFVCRLFLSRLRSRNWSDELIVIPRHEVVHAAVYGGTGSGKSQSSAIPNIRADQGSVIVLDPKSELAIATAQERSERFGQRSIIIDPFGLAPEHLGRDSFNPLSVVSMDSPLALSDAAYFAEALIKKEANENNPFFTNSARVIIDSLLSFLFAHSTAKDCTLQKLREITVNPQALDEIVSFMTKSTAQGGHIRRKGLQVAALEGKTRTDVLSTLNTNLYWLDSPIIEASTNQTTFDIEEIVDGRASLYFMLPPDHAENYSPLIRAWITAIALRIFRAGESSNRSVTLYLDEVSLLGSDLRVLETILTKGRSYGLRTVSYWQSTSQLTQVYPEQQAVTYRDNMSVEQFMGVNSITTATEISKWIGQTTIQTQSEQVSSGTSWQSNQANDSTSFSENSSVTTQLAGRALVQAEEILQLDGEATVVLKPRCPPLLLNGIRDYRIKDRLLVMHLDVKNRIKALHSMQGFWGKTRNWITTILFWLSAPIGAGLIVCCIWFSHLGTLPPGQREKTQFIPWASQHVASFKSKLNTTTQGIWNNLQTFSKDSK